MKLIKSKKYKLLLLAITSVTGVMQANAQESKPKPEFEIVKFNNPGLVVDLGVGLWAYPVPIDFDHDGDMDLVVSCASKPYNGLYLFENTSGDKIPVFAAPKRLTDGIEQFTVSYVDGEPHVFANNKELRDFTTKLDADSVKYPVKAGGQWRLVDYDGDGDLDVITGTTDWNDYGWDNAYNDKGEWTRGPLHGYVNLYENIDGKKYENRGKVMAGGKPVDTYGLPSPSFADFDNDGDLDLICGEYKDQFTWYENIGTRTKPVYAEGRFLENDKGIISMDLQMIIPVYVDWDKDGFMDLIVGDEDGRVALIRNTGKVKDHMPIFESPYYFKQIADDLKFGVLVTPYSVDWDDDGDEDIIVGNSAGYIGFIENLGGYPVKWAEPKKLEADGEVIRIMAGNGGSIQGPVEKKWGYTTVSVADWDGDGLKDIIYNSIWGSVEWFKNIGSKGNPKLAKSQTVKVDWEGKTPPKPSWVWWTPKADQLVTQWRTTPYAIDWNKDCLVDLVMLDHEGYLALFERKKVNNELLLTPGKRIFYGMNGANYNSWNAQLDKKDDTGPLRLNGEDFGKSGRRKFTFTDWDGDGDLDLMTNGLNAVFYENIGTKDGHVQFVNRERLTNLRLAGHTNSATMVNWRKAATKDLLVGASDGHFYFYKKD